jgi:hypothetical protein
LYNLLDFVGHNLPNLFTPRALDLSERPSSIVPPDGGPSHSTGPPPPKSQKQVLRALTGISRSTNLYLFLVVVLLIIALLWSFVAFRKISTQLPHLEGSAISAGISRSPRSGVQQGVIGDVELLQTGDLGELRGPSGMDGTPGPEGPAGADGATGPTGLQGIDASDGLDKVGSPVAPTLIINDNPANGLAIVSDVLTINDTSANGLVLVGDVLAVNVADGLARSGDAVAVVAANPTITVSASGISVGVIGDSNIAFGVGAGTVDAADIPIADTGGFYATNTIEAAFAQIAGADITSVGTAAGTGLQGGAASGSAALSLLTSCAPGEILKWDGAVWACAVDDSAVGSVNSVSAGAGLSNSGTAIDPILDVNDSGTNGLVITANILTINDSATNGLALVGDVLTVSTGNGLGLSGNTVVAVAADSTITVGVGGISVGTIGDSDIAFGVGAGTVSGADIPIADAGGFYTTNDVESALAQIQGADITSISTAAGTGLTGGTTSGAAALSLLTTCAPGEILKWGGAAWACASDANAGGTVTSVTAGAGLANSGTAQDPILDVGAGSGITVNANDIALGSLTADWNQTGAFDINLNNASSELRILESAGATFFGALDVGDLGANATYTLSGASGTILTDANYAVTLDSIYVNVGESPAAGDITGSFTAGLTVGANSVALGTDTTNDYVASLTAGGGLTGDVTGEGSTPTVAVVSSNGGIVVNANDIALTIALSANGLSATTSSGSGLEILGSGLALLQGCADTEVLKWNETTDVWACSADANSVTNSFATIDTPAGTDPTADAATDSLQLLASGTNLTITGANDPETITFDIAESALAGAGLVANGDALDIGAGSGITVGAGDVALGPLTADWNQTGAFDIALNNASSELRILESTGATFFGTLDVGDLAANAIYTLSGTSGTILTDANYSGTLDPIYVNIAESPAAGDITGSFSGGLTVGANAVALGTDTTNDYVASLTAGGGLTGDVTGESSTPTVAVVSANGGIAVNANDIALTIAASANALSATTSTGSGLEILSSGITLLQGCTDGELLKWNETTDVWACSSDTTGTTTNSFATIDTPTGTDPTADAPTDSLQPLTTGTNLTIAGANDPETITFDIVESVLAGAGLAVNGDALDIGAGSGITVGANDVALGPLTANWNQTGAFDISLNNAASELQILESTGATFFGTLDVGDLAANATYTLSGTSGNILTDANYSGTLDPIYVNVGESPAAGDITGSFSGGLTVGTNAVALGTDTTNDYVATLTAGGGLTGDVTGEGSTPTVAVVSANGGIVVNANDIALTIAPSANGLSATTSSGSGLEVLASGLTLLQGCADTEILKWNETTDVWACSADAGGSSNSFATIDTPAGTDPTADSATDSLQLLATGTNLTITGANDPETITFDIAESVLAGAGLAVNGGALDIGAGSGITANANDIALGPLTANWNQTGAFDISLNNAASELQILESTGATFFGTLDVGDLAANATYTLSGTSGTILTDTNYTGTLDPVYVNVGESPAAGDITGSFTAGLTVGANAVALGTDTTGDYVATLTAGGGLTGDVTGEGSTPTVAVVSANGGIIVNANDIALTIAPSANGLSATTSSGSGLEILGSGLALIQGCADTEILKWNETTDVWACSSDSAGTTSNSFTTIDTPAGTDPTADSATDTLQLLATGTNLTVTGANDPETITFDLQEGTLAGAGLVANGDALDVGAGNGITVGVGDVALGPLTANWNQTGAFDISLNNASSELQILESTGATFFGTLDVGDLGANATYTLSGASGTILTDANYTGTLDAVYVNVGESPAAGDIAGSFSGGLTVGANAVALGTDTTNDYVATLTAGGGLTGDVTGESSTPTVAVASANGGIVVNANDIALTVAPSANGLSATTSSGSGLEILGSGLALIQGCADTEVLKWNETTDVWACAADATGGSVNSFATIDTPAGTDPTADTSTDSLQLLATGTNLTVTGANDPETITFDIAESVLAGAGLAVNGDALDIGAGNGITVGANDIALGPLTANWNQTGAFDISLNNASSELQILESTGATFFGTLDVGDLGANATYTLSGTSGTILTDANYTGTLDAVYVNVGESPAAGDIAGSFSGGLTVGANAVALGTDTTNDYVATLTAGGGLTGDVTGESSTPTVAVVSANGGIVVNANDIALTVAPSANGLSATTSSGSGLETLASGLTLLQGCADTEILKWNEASDIWACSADAGGSSNSFATIDTPAGTDPTADTSTDSLQLLATGTNLTVTGANDPETITFDIAESVLAGAGLAVNGDALDIGAGNGITVGANDVALGPLTANWNQTGAFDISLNNAGSELQILESTGATFFGTLDVGDLGANATYTLSGTSGTILTDANYTGTLDAVYVNVGESPAAADITGSFSGGLTVGANAVALGTDTTNDYVASITAGAGLTGDASGETSTPTLAVVSGNGGIVANANDIALTVAPSANGLSSTTSSGSGLEVLASGVALIQGCADTEILKWNETTDVWACSADAGGSSNSFATIDTPAGTDPTADTSTDSLQLLATGANVTITGANDPETITFNIVESTLAGAGLAANGDALDIASANGGIVANANDIALTVAPSANGLSSTTSSGSGMEVVASGLALIQGCADTEILKWNETTDVWACGADVSGGSVTLQGAYDNDAGSDALIAFTTADDSIIFQNPASLGTDSAFLLQLDQVASAAVDGLLINSVASGMTDAIDVTDTDIVNAINIGSNTILGTTGVIDFTNFDVASTGALTFTSVTTDITTGTNEDFNIAPNGTGEVTIGTSDTTGTQLVLDIKTDSGDPTGIEGGMYYNSNSDKFRCFEASAWKDCDTTGGGGGATLLRVTADVSNSSNPSLFADVTGLTISLTSGTTYSFTCDMSYTTSATTNALQLSVNGPAATELDYTVLTATSATASHHAAQTAYDTVLNPATGGGATRLPVRLQGTVTPSANGTFAVRLRPETAGSAVVVKRGSFCLVNTQ